VSRDGTNSLKGIFPSAVDTAAFGDTVNTSVRGPDLSPELDGLMNVKNTASFSKKSRYARCLTAEIRDTGNPLQAAYGKAGEKAALTAIPDAMVVFRSEQTILTGAQIIRDMGNLFPSPTRFELSLVEFTFDVSSPGLEAIRRQAIHRARQTCSLVDDTGRRTFYVGSRHSPWQLRVYDKKGIVRIEFVFRREFLFKNGLLHPIDLLKLRVFDLEQLVTFRRVSPEHLEEAAPDRSAKWREGVVRWAERWPISKLPSYLRDHGISPGKVLRPTQLQRKIESMQRQFIW
jgi:hypothetical protein